VRTRQAEQSAAADAAAPYGCPQPEALGAAAPLSFVVWQAEGIPMAMSYDDAIRQLKSRGCSTYSSGFGPIDIDQWSGPRGGKNGYWLFVGSRGIKRDPKYKSMYGTPLDEDEIYEFC